MTIRLLVFGGRDFRDKALLWRRLDEIDLALCIDLIIEGEAAGADRLAQKWAEERKCPWHPFPANWYPDGKTLDRGAGPKRNQQMIREGCPTHALECPGGTGTADMRGRLLRAGIEPMRLIDPLENLL